MDKSGRTESFLAVVIGTSALAIAAYTAMLQRQQTRAQVWPSLEVTQHSQRDEDSLPDGGLQIDDEWSIVIHNRGTGPARVRSFSVSVDGTPVKGWRELVGRFGVEAESSINESSVREGTVISAGEERTILEMKGGSAVKKILDGKRRVTTSICYCSLLDECWLSEPRTEKSVPRCPSGQGYAAD